VALGDIANFISRIFGDVYQPKNNFSFGVKQQILAYLYEKNDFDISESKKKPSSNLGASGHLPGDKVSIKARLEYLKEIDKYNRMFLISSMADSQRRLRFTGGF
jgi:hypothetical protein